MGETIYTPEQLRRYARSGLREAATCWACARDNRRPFVYKGWRLVLTGGTDRVRLVGYGLCRAGHDVTANIAI